MAAGVLLGHELLDLGGVGAADQLADPDGPVHIVGVDEYIDAVNAGLPQKFVGAEAQDHAGTLLGEAEDHGLLHVVDGLLGVAVIGAGDGAKAPEERVRPGAVLLFRLHQLCIKAAGFHGFPENVLVIKGNAQLLGYLLADGVAAGTVFPADGDDLLHPVCLRFAAAWSGPLWPIIPYPRP